jgi:hypothetical protein
MAHASGDTPYVDPNNPSKSSNDDIPAPSFPNTRFMNPTTDLSRNPGIFDDVFKKIKGKNSLICFWK